MKYATTIVASNNLMQFYSFQRIGKHISRPSNVTARWYFSEITIVQCCDKESACSMSRRLPVDVAAELRIIEQRSTRRNELIMTRMYKENGRSRRLSIRCCCTVSRYLSAIVCIYFATISPRVIYNDLLNNARPSIEPPAFAVPLRATKNLVTNLSVQGRRALVVIERKGEITNATVEYLRL